MFQVMNWISVTFLNNLPRNHYNTVCTEKKCGLLYKAHTLHLSLFHIFKHNQPLFWHFYCLSMKKNFITANTLSSPAQLCYTKISLHPFLDNKLITSGTDVTFLATIIITKDSLSHKFTQPNLSRKAKYLQNTSFLNLAKPSCWRGSIATNKLNYCPLWGSYLCRM